MNEKRFSNKIIPIRPVMLLIVGMMLFIGSCGPFHHEAAKLFTPEDVKLIHPKSKASLQHHHLTAEESRSINERIGRPATSSDELIPYYKVQPQAKRPLGESGTVFVGKVTTVDGDSTILVSVRDKVVQAIKIKEGMNVPVILPEFLKQFIGRGLEQSFKVGTSPEEFDRVPTPLKPLAGNIELSRQIADVVHKILVVDAVLGI